MLPIASVLPPLPRLKIVDVGAMWTGGMSDRYANLHARPAVRRHRVRARRCGVSEARCDGPAAASLFSVFHRRRLGADFLRVQGSLHLVAVRAGPRDGTKFRASGGGPCRSSGRIRFKPRVSTISPRWRTSIFSRSTCKAARSWCSRARRLRQKSAVIVDVEVDFIPLYKNQPLFADVDFVPAGAGFMLHQMHPYNLSVQTDGRRRTRAQQHRGRPPGRTPSMCAMFPAFERCWSRTRSSSSRPSCTRTTGHTISRRACSAPTTA